MYITFLVQLTVARIATVIRYISYFNKKIFNYLYNLKKSLGVHLKKITKFTLTALKILQTSIKSDLKFLNI